MRPRRKAKFPEGAVRKNFVRELTPREVGRLLERVNGAPNPRDPQGPLDLYYRPPAKTW